MPGYTTTVDSSLGGYTNDVQNLLNTARGQNPGSFAGVAWLGYEAPVEGDNFDDLDLTEGVLNEQRAITGDQLAGFIDGIDAARGPDNDPHLTALGHSYGLDHARECLIS